MQWIVLAVRNLLILLFYFNTIMILIDVYFGTVFALPLSK